jgi:hypothetical protein
MHNGCIFVHLTRAFAKVHVGVESGAQGAQSSANSAVKAQDAGVISWGYFRQPKGWFSNSILQEADRCKTFFTKRDLEQTKDSTSVAREMRLE